MQVEVLFIKIECIVVPRRTPGHRVFRFTSKLEFCFVAWGAHADRYDRATDQKKNYRPINDRIPAIFVGEMTQF